VIVLKNAELISGLTQLQKISWVADVAKGHMELTTEL